jgi:hypothetical protein
MTPPSMNRFLHLMRTGEIDKDPTWRAYSFVPAIKDIHVKAALKALGLDYAGEHALSQFAVLYEVPQRNARETVGAWWLWSRLASGKRVRGPKPRSATTLPGGGHSASPAPSRPPV